jgi:MoaA/NifB/PqqE/SkfB family radical SAM enzyme
MSKKDYNNILNNGSFCTAPWVHLHIVPDGKLLPCCGTDFTESMNISGYGNAKNGIKEAFNSSRMKELRLELLEGQRPPECYRCFEREDNGMADSMRSWFNKSFNDDDVKNLVENKTTGDGEVTEMNIKYLDIRFGNICNLKCRMCGLALSSSWFDEEVEFKKLEGAEPPTQKFIHVDMYDELENYLPYVEQIYFAGGEPMLYPEHFKILKKLIELDKTDVIIKYNTNLSTLHYKGESVVDLWKNFKSHIVVGASVDGMGKEVEYIRTGVKWSKLEENLDLLTEADNVLVWPSTTVGLLNIHTLPAFWDYSIKKGWDNAPYQVNFIQHPDWMCLKNMPSWLREQCIDLIKSYINTLEERKLDHHIEGFMNIVRYIESSTTDDKTASDYMDFGLMMLNLYKKTANITWEESLPHLIPVYDKHRNFKNESGF